MINLSIKMEQIGEYNVTQNVRKIKQGTTWVALSMFKAVSKIACSILLYNYYIFFQFLCFLNNFNPNLGGFLGVYFEVRRGSKNQHFLAK